jgi:ATP-dependent Clp protease adaptor protein ClpS
MSTIIKEQISSQLEEILTQPYVLILHNDDYNSFDFVINSLISVCGHEYEQASQCAHIVHFTGKCDVKRGDHENINKMYSKLKTLGLSVTMEVA